MTRPAASAPTPAPPGRVEAVVGVDAGRAVPGVTSCHVAVGVGDVVRELRSSWDRVASAMACGATAGEALRRAEEALASVRLEVAPC